MPHERYSQETKTSAKEVLSGYPEIYEGALLKLSDDREVLKKLIEKDDGDSKNWCYVDALLLNFRCEAHFFKGVAVAEKTFSRVIDTWYRRFGCVLYWLWINGRRRPCEDALQRVSRQERSLF